MRVARIIILGYSIFYLFLLNCKAQPNKEVENKVMNPQDIRKAVVAGSWYSSNPDELREEI